MPARDVIPQILDFNAQRDPAGVALKYQAMAQSPFGFLRGSCHLFYQDLPIAEPVFKTAPLTWICGDLHLQNFGTYKGEDRLVYFDINDFDEACLATCTWELARFLTSLFVATSELGYQSPEATELAQTFLNAYTAELATGKDRTIHRETAKGLVEDLILKLQQRDGLRPTGGHRVTFLDKRTAAKSKHRKLKLIEGKTREITPQQQESVTTLLQTWAANQPDPDFYQVLDVKYRLAGNGSLGLERYLILVEGKGSPDQNYLLDLKESRPSSFAARCQNPQPQWRNEADRIVSIQYRYQESPPALLHRLASQDRSFVLRELQPSADKIEFDPQNPPKFKALCKLVTTMAEVVAWGQLRSSGRQGSAIADDLITFAEHAADWHKPLLDYSQQYATQVQRDHQTFQAQILEDLQTSP
jgi:uncharacterized protein (DUF2252 family)